MLRKFFVATTITVFAIGSTACATKKFVRSSVGEVNEKVDPQGGASDETQERTRRTEGRISEVDQKAGAAGQAAQAAHDAANAANSAAEKAATVGNEANSKIDTFDKASKRLVYEVVLSEDQDNLKGAKTTLPEKA